MKTIKIPKRDLTDYKLLDRYYLSEPSNVDKAVVDTGLSMLEIKDIVGQFGKNSSRQEQMRGQVFKYIDGTVEIKHHFSVKTLWRKD